MSHVSFHEPHGITSSACRDIDVRMGPRPLFDANLWRYYDDAKRTLRLRKAVAMMSRVLSCFVTIGVLVLSACSAGGAPQSVLPQNRTIESAPIMLQTDALPASTHFLYAAALNVVNIYALPLTASSKPVHTIAGFTGAGGVKVGTTNINVIDNQNNVDALNIYFASGVNALKKRCSVAYTSPFGIAIQSDSLYLVSTALREVSQFADTESTTGTPQPCSGEMPVNDKNGLANPQGVAADGKFVYIADFNHHTLAVYPQPLKSAEPAKFTLGLGAAPGSLALSNTDIYVAFTNGGFVDDFKLPLSSLSVPTKLKRAPLVHPFGLALFPRPSVSAPTELFVSDEGTGDIYTYRLPLKSTSVPSVTTTLTNAFGMDAK